MIAAASSLNRVRKSTAHSGWGKSAKNGAKDPGMAELGDVLDRLSLGEHEVSK